MDVASILAPTFLRAPFSHLGGGVIDLKTGASDLFLWTKNTKSTEILPLAPKDIIFDLASLTKPLSLWPLWCQHPQLFTPQRLLLMEHRGGIPSWGLLSKKTWREDLKILPVAASTTCYSDLGVMRLQVECEAELGEVLSVVLKKSWREDLIYWRELSLSQQRQCIPTGFRRNKIICGEVHDPNAFIIPNFTVHAGLFASVDSLAQLINRWQKEFHLSSTLLKLWEERERENDHSRFLYSWDKVSDPNNTLAGKGCSAKTLGHLGFVGQSLWIDLVKQRAHFLLSNATQHYWYEKKLLNEMRRSIGQFYWAMA